MWLWVKTNGTMLGPILVCFSGEWDVHWILTHGHVLQQAARAFWNSRAPLERGNLQIRPRGPRQCAWTARRCQWMWRLWTDRTALISLALVGAVTLAGAG